MIKLTRALLDKTAQVLDRIVYRFSIERSVERHHKLSAIDESVLHGLLLMIDQVEEFEITNMLVLNAQAERIPLSRCALFLRQLKVSELIELFLCLEELVMGSGQGSIFQRWRHHWRQCLMIWVRHIEGIQRRVERLGELNPLSDTQRSDLNQFRHFYHTLSERVVDHSTTFIEGRGALSTRLVILLKRPKPLSGSLLGASIDQIIVREFEGSEVEAEDEINKRNLFFTAHTIIPLSSFIPFLRSLCALNEINEYELITQERFPLCAHLLYRRNFPNRYRGTPPRSLRAWFFREVQAIFAHLSILPKYACIHQAHSMSEMERSLWEQWLSYCQVTLHPFTLVLIADEDQASSEQSFGALETARWSSIGAYYNEISVHPTFAKSKINLSTSSSISITQWTKQWTETLLGQVTPSLIAHDTLNGVSWELEESLESQADEQSLWWEVLDELSPRLQAYLILCLGLGSSTFDACGLSIERSFNECSLRLREAGWLIRVGERDHSSVQRLDEWSQYQLRHPEVIAFKPQLKSELGHMVQSLSRDLLKDQELEMSWMGCAQAKLLRYIVSQCQLSALELSHDALMQTTEMSSKHLDHRFKSLGFLEFNVTDDHVHQAHPRLKAWVQLELKALRTNAQQQEMMSEAQLFALEEGAFIIGDLECLAEVENLRSRRLLQEGQLIKSIDALLRAKLLFKELMISKAEMSCRLDFVLILIQSGLQEVAQVLLNAEREIAALCQEQNDKLQLCLGMCSLHQGDWHSALAALSNVSAVNGDIIALRALTHLKQGEHYLPQVSERMAEERSLQLSRVIELSREALALGFSSLDMSALNLWVFMRASYLNGEMYEALSLFKDFEYQWAQLDRSSTAQNSPTITRATMFRAWTYQLAIAQGLEADPIETSNLQLDLERCLTEVEILKREWYKGYDQLIQALKDQPKRLRSMTPNTPQVASQISQLDRIVGTLHADTKREKLVLWELTEEACLTP